MGKETLRFILVLVGLIMSFILGFLTHTSLETGFRAIIIIDAVVYCVMVFISVWLIWRKHDNDTTDH